MPPLYIVEKGTRLSSEQRNIVITTPTGAKTKRPLAHTSAVIIFGNASVTTPALKRLMRLGIDVVFLTINGRYAGRLVGPLSKFGLLRQRQYETLRDPAFRLQIAQAIVRAKCLNLRTVLLRANRDRLHPAIGASIERLGWLAERALRTTRVNALLGVEGQASAAYFSVFRHLLQPEWTFERRMRRPPPDPVNVLLSFGYTLLARELEASVSLVGLDPYLGCLHTTEYGRPSLALDLMEEFRAIIVDSVVLRCVNNDLLKPDDFAPGKTPDRPILLGDAGKRRFLQAFEDRVMTTIQHPITGETLTYRRVFELQTRLLARCIRDQTPDYLPFRVR